MFLLIRSLKTLNFSFEFDVNGISINSISGSQRYKWDELKNSKDYPSCQIFCLMDKDGNHLFLSRSTLLITQTLDKWLWIKSVYNKSSREFYSLKNTHKIPAWGVSCLMNIVPLIGLKSIEFGESKEKAIKLFGEPDLVENVLGQDGVSSETWEFKSKGLKLYFDPDLEFRLWEISITSETVQLNHIRPIGLDEAELLINFPSLVLEVNDGIFKEYVDSSRELVFFLRNNIVERIDLSPNLDDYLKGLV
ncbi:hypothetical protein P4S63_19125 [Pseudoalteromonas sp. B193]